MPFTPRLHRCPGVCRACHAPSSPGQQRGWTLSELLIALALMGILSALALPAYQQQQRKAWRSEARVALQQLQFDQASYRIQNTRYASSLDALGRSPHSPAGRYSLRISAADETGYTLEALPQGPQAADTACAPMRLSWRDPALQVLSSGPLPDADPARCWTP